jgi:integrase/recombinase XerD
MPIKLSTLLASIDTSVHNQTNAILIKEFYDFMKANGTSESYQKNNLKTIINFAKYLDNGISFYQLNNKEQIIEYLNTKIKNIDNDPDKRWITTWNDYLGRIKFFIRWINNQKKNETEIDISDWQTPSFVQIKKKKTKRLSPYLESELWERDEVLAIIKYEPYKRNKAVLSLLWDLDARNHEITLLKIKHILLRERYGEGEIPHEAKTGSGPILLTCSFPYVRDWLNEHPFKYQPNARLICNLYNGAPITPDALWVIMKQLKMRILRLLENNSTINIQERQILERLIKTKKWNPYCIRHSAITSDSDFLPEYALKKKVRWSMNSKQGSRYIKRRMGDDLKNQILIRNGIFTEESAAIQRKSSILNCFRCSLVNAIDNKYCSKCSYPLTPQAYEEIKEIEDTKLKAMEQKHEQDMKAVHEEMENKFQQILAKIDTGKLS